MRRGYSCEHLLMWQLMLIMRQGCYFFFFFSSRRRHTRCSRDWSSDVCSSDLMAELKALKVRVQGAPIWSRTFTAAGMAPTVIAYNEVYNAIQNGVIAAGENEAAGVEQMKFYEVAPHLSMTQHAITIRPLCFSTKTFKKLDVALQAAVLKAGKGAGAPGRQSEAAEG